MLIGEKKYIWQVGGSACCCSSVGSTVVGKTFFPYRTFCCHNSMLAEPFVSSLTTE